MDKDLFSLFLRQIILDEIGWEGQKKIMNASVLLVGAGGIGCPAFTYLQRSGIKKIGIVDFDEVHVSNLHRQFMYSENEIGQLKTEVLRKKIMPYKHQSICFYGEKAEEKNIKSLIGSYDLVLDGTDNFESRYMINDACVQAGKTLVTASILGFVVQLFVFNLEGSKNLRDIFPDPPRPEDVPSCSENGVLPTVAGMAGLLAAHEALKVILGISSLKNRFLLCDWKEFQFELVEY